MPLLTERYLDFQDASLKYHFQIFIVEMNAFGSTRGRCTPEHSSFRAPRPLLQGGYSVTPPGASNAG